MAEAQPPLLGVQQAGALGRLEVRGREPDGGERGVDAGERQLLVGGRQQQRADRRRRQRGQLGAVGALDRRARPDRLPRRDRALPLRVAERARQLDERERIARRRRHDPLQRRFGERALVVERRGGGVHERAGVGVGERGQRERLEPARGQPAVGLRAGGEQHDDALVQQPAGGEAERVERGVVEPVDVVDEHRQPARRPHRRRLQQPQQRDSRRRTGVGARPPTRLRTPTPPQARPPGPAAAPPAAARARRSSSLNPAKASAVSASTARARSSVISRARAEAAAASSRLLFPMPASPSSRGAALPEAAPASNCSIRPTSAALPTRATTQRS